jgi:hypothetical protein
VIDEIALYDATDAAHFVMGDRIEIFERLSRRERFKAWLSRVVLRRKPKVWTQTVVAVQNGTITLAMHEPDGDS